jgi:ParB/RepB/Spo0J family partition protein
MATPTATETPTSSDANATPARSQRLGDIPLSSITVAEGFNPRGVVIEDDELHAMAATIRERGCLQSVLVRVADDGGYVLVAGERRYRAALLAEATSIPAIVASPTGDEAEQELELLCAAVIENEVRSDFDPLQRARGYKALMDRGKTVRGVADLLGGSKHRRARENRVKAHLPILELPEDIQNLVAEEKVPLFAVKALVGLCEIHADFARAAVKVVIPSEEEYLYSWREFVEAPMRIALDYIEEMPDGIFKTGVSCPVTQFTLTETARKNLASYTKLTGGEITAVRFGEPLVEQARLLGAVRGEGWRLVIIGQDVADRLAEDYIASALKDARATAKRQRQAATSSGGVEAPQSPDASSGLPEDPVSRAREGFEARVAAEREQRPADVRFNLELGLLAFKYLPKLKVDERVIRILASVNLGSDLQGIAELGARLTMPDWVTQTQQKNGKTKTVYLDPLATERKAETFLAGARSAGEIAGRALTLIALASLARQNAVAKSNRSFYHLSFSGPWAVQAQRDLNAIVRERIKEGQLAELDDILVERLAHDENDLRDEEEAADARLRLEDIKGRLGELTDEQLDGALKDAQLAWGSFALEAHDLKKQIKALRAERATAESQDEPAQQAEAA